MQKFAEKMGKGLLGEVKTWTELAADGSEFPGGFKIMADKGGIRFEGESSRIESKEELDAFAAVIGQAATFWMRMRPKITNAAGH